MTNPFFGKALKHWPHIVKLGDHNTLNGLLKSPSKSNGVADKQKGMSKFKLDSKPGLYSSTKTLLDKDKGKKTRQIKAHIFWLFIGQTILNFRDF